MKWILIGLLLLAFSGLGLGWLATGTNPPATSPLADDALPPEASCPVLVLVNERGDNPFGSYLGEILRAEGLNCFRLASIATASMASAENVATAILAEGPLATAEAIWLRDLVEGGGRLIAMRPDALLDPMLGIERVSGQSANGYVRTVRDHALTAGIASGPLQFHGVADHYRTAGAEVVAWISDDAGGESAFPGITVHPLGRGTAIAWSFDLARSVVYTRQGNPARAGQERTGLEGARAGDLFNAWLDLDRLPVPQADEEQRLLANLVVAGPPLPRLWYFPGTVDGMIIATGDAHGSSAAAIDEVLRHVERLGGHMSIYYLPPPSTVAQRMRRRMRGWFADLPLVGAVARQGSPFPAEVGRWRERGHEFALHPDAEDLTEEWREFTGLGYAPVPPTVRAHIAWRGWVDSARALATHGFRMDLDYDLVGPAFRDESDTTRLGYFTGSGLPMRLIDERGQILSIYQQAIQLVDEEVIDLPPGRSGSKLAPEAAVDLAAAFLQRVPYAAVGAQFHVDPFAIEGAPAAAAKKWMTGTLGAAAAEGFPIWSAEQWLRFTEARAGAVFDALRWDEGNRRLFFRLRAEPAANVELSVLVPMQQGTARLAHMAVDGEEVRSHLRRVGAVTYGGVTVAAGTHTIAATYTD